MRILFINPTSFETYMPSFGLGYVASYLRRQGHQCRLVEMGGKTKADVESIVLSFLPDVVGIAVWCRGFRHAIRCASYFREEYPDVIRIAGGPLASFVPDELLMHDCFHYVVAGAGEIAMTRLLDEIGQCHRIPEHTIPGVYYKGHTKQQEFGEDIKDIDHAPFPDRDPDANFMLPNTLMVNRGCNHRCIFCANPVMTKLKIRSLPAVIPEIKRLLEHPVPQKPELPDLHFLDDNMAVSPLQLTGICAFLEEEFYGVTWAGHVRADIDFKILDIMAASGCTYLGVGAESGNDSILAKINKRTTVQQIEEMVTHASSIGIVIRLSYIVGHFCDTPRTMDDTIAHAIRMNKEHGAQVSLSSNTLFPGTPQYEMREQLGLKIHATSWDQYDTNCPSISGRAFTLEDLQERLYQFRRIVKLHDERDDSPINRPSGLETCVRPGGVKA